MKSIIITLFALLSMSASAAKQDSIKVVFDFNANPWGYTTALPKGTSYSKVDVDNSPAEAFFTKNTDITVDVNGKPLTLTLTPSDLDETDYDNCMFYTYDYDTDMSGNTRINVLKMYTGSSMTFKAPEGYKMAKVKFSTFRSWASGGLGQHDYTWGPDTAKVYDNYNDKGEIIWSIDCWYGDEYEWSTPACTGSTVLRSITAWLLPLNADNDDDEPTSDTPVKGDIDGDGAVTISDITELISIYLEQ